MSEIISCYRWVTEDLKSVHSDPPTQWVPGEWQNSHLRQLIEEAQ